MRLRLAAALFALVWLLPASASAQSLAEQSAFQYLQRNAARHGLSSADVAELVASDAVVSRRSGVTAVYLHQAVAGVPVVAGQMTVSVRPDGRVLHATGRLVPNLDARTATASASVTAPAAAEAIARAVQTQSGLVSQGFSVVEAAATPAGRLTLTDGGIARLPVLARLVWADPTPETDGDALRLAWEATLYLPGARGDWYGLVDARSGAVLVTRDVLVREADGFETFAARSPLGREARATVAPVVAARATADHDGHVAATHSGSPFLDITDALTASPAAGGGARYRVYAPPVESPNHALPIPPADARTVEVDPHDAMASPYAWHDDNGADGAEYTNTRGNNVWAFLDVNNDDTYNAGDSPDCGAALDCDFPISLTGAPSTYRPAAVANLFYWNNVIHDVFWHYGFDEASGNFRKNNYGRGGLGNDAVDAHAQDGSGTNNANMSTPPDGQNPTMQMYIGTGATPDTDGDFDNAVIAHEYGHGISVRLTGGPQNVDCLWNGEQMGEGWSDYFGLMLTMEAGDAGADPRGMGTYLFGQPATGPGIRPARYSTSFAVNNYTYGDIGSLAIPHGVGFAWATMIWDMTWDLVDLYGFDPDVYNAEGTAGNQIAMALVVEALKIQPCSPGFVDGRDAILAADVALYDGAHTETIWAAFARRGLGIGADQGSTESTSDGVESFAEPEALPPAPVTDLTATANGDFVTLSFTATGDDGQQGTATLYDVRYATTPITTDAEFSAATQMTGEPLPEAAGTTETMQLPGLTFNSTYYVAMKVGDNSFNISAMSNAVEVTTLGAPVAGVPTETIVASVSAPGETVTETVTLSNSGPSDLRYSVSLAEATRRPAPVYGVGTPEPEARKDAPAGPVGQAAERGRGGPDDFGYSWVDSNEPGGPAFDWVDISATGTAVSLSDDDDQTVTLPFAFPYYGTDRTSVRIVSNGWLGFGGSSVSYSNEGIPSSAEPNNMIAALWDDLNPGDGGQVRYQNMGDGRFVVSWLAVPPYSGSGTFTFQIILHANGQIVYQYQTMGGSTTSATVGIESPDGSDGLEVASDRPYVANGLAVRFSALWVDASPVVGLVPAGGTADVSLLFDATGLAIGQYDATMTVSTNDPNQPTVTVPITFAVGAVADEAPAEAFEGTHRLSAVFPNPASTDARLSLAVAQTQTVRVELYDALGRRVALLHDGDLAARQTVTLDVAAARLAAGAYVVRVTGEHFADTRRLTVSH